MKLRKIMALCLVLMMIISMTGCSLKKEDSTDASKEEQNISEKEEGQKDNSELHWKDSEQTKEIEQESSEADKKHSDMVHLMVGSAYEHEWYEEYSVSLAHASYPEIILQDCCEEKYEALEEALDDLNEEERASVRNQYWDLIETAKEDERIFSEYFQMYEVSENVSVRRADSNVVSLLYDGYAYLGGAHGMSYYWAKNIDTKTGEVLLLSDVVTDMELLAGMLKAELYTHVEREAFFSDSVIEETVLDMWNRLTWTMDYHGITFYFDPYVLGSYASGAFTATLSYDEYPDLVKDKYKQVPDSYTVQLSTALPFYYDLTGDGVVEEINVWGMMDSYDTYNNHVIEINGNRHEYERWSYDIDPIFVHMGDGNNYLYVQDTSDNDYRTINIYKINNGQIEELGYINLGWYTQQNSDDQDEIWGHKQVLTDVKAFRLETYSSILSSVSTYKNYIINSNGVPASADKYYYVQNDFHLTVMKPLDVEVVDGKTFAPIGTATIGKGTVVQYYASDNEQVGILKLPDGSLAKVVLDNSNWPIVINGVTLEEQFDGIMFAG